MRHDLRPAPDIGQPADRAPSDEYAVERRRLGDRREGVIQIGLDEPGTPTKAQFIRQPSRRLDRRRRKIEPNNLSAALRQGQRIAAEMALQVENTQPVDRAQLCLFDRVQQATPSAQCGQIVGPRGQMDGYALVPVGAIERAPIGLRPTGF